MARNHIINAVEDRIAVVTISHPPVNSLNEDVIKELEGDKNVGAVVITGGGEKAFVAGSKAPVTVNVPSSAKMPSAAEKGPV